MHSLNDHLGHTLQYPINYDSTLLRHCCLYWHCMQQGFINNTTIISSMTLRWRFSTSPSSSDMRLLPFVFSPSCPFLSVTFSCQFNNPGISFERIDINCLMNKSKHFWTLTFVSSHVCTCHCWVNTQLLKLTKDEYLYTCEIQCHI